MPTQAPDCPRLRTVIGKKIERMIEGWGRDWIGFGEGGAREQNGWLIGEFERFRHPGFHLDPSAIIGYKTYI
jgi:hypothetical protein